MKPSRKTEIHSIFGQIEAAAAEYMISQGRAKKIPANQIPYDVSLNDVGTPARFAIVVTGPAIQEFDRVCKELRA